VATKRQVSGKEGGWKGRERAPSRFPMGQGWGRGAGSDGARLPDCAEGDGCDFQSKMLA